MFTGKSCVIYKLLKFVLAISYETLTFFIAYRRVHYLDTLAVKVVPEAKSHDHWIFEQRSEIIAYPLDNLEGLHSRNKKEQKNYIVALINLYRQWFEQMKR